MPNEIQYDLTAREADPESLSLGKNDEKDITIKFKNLGYTTVTSTDFDYSVQLTPEKLAQLEGWAVVVKTEDSSKVKYIITSTRFHFDITLLDYAALPSDIKGPGSDYVFFVVDEGSNTTNTTQYVMNGEIEEAILLIKEAREYINSRGGSQS